MDAKGRMDVNDFVRSRIRELRLSKHLRVADVARRAGIPFGSYSCLETGKYRLNMDTLCRILLALEAPISDVWPTAGCGVPAVVDEVFIAAMVREAEEKARQARVEPADLLQAVARTYGIAIADLCGRSSKRPLAEARAVASLLCDGFPHVTKTGLAQEMGREVSGLVHAASRLRERLRPTQLARILRSVKRELKEILRERPAASSHCALKG